MQLVPLRFMQVTEEQRAQVEQRNRDREKGIQSLGTDHRPGGLFGIMANRPPGKMDHATVACYQVRGAWGTYARSTQGMFAFDRVGFCIGFRGSHATCRRAPARKALRCRCQLPAPARCLICRSGAARTCHPPPRRLPPLPRLQLLQRPWPRRPRTAPPQQVQQQRRRPGLAAPRRQAPRPQRRLLARRRERERQRQGMAAAAPAAATATGRRPA